MTKSPEAFFNQRRIHHTEAIERNESLCDRRPTCPTALVLHITKSHVAIPHIYRFVLGYLLYPPVFQSTDPFVSFIVLLHLDTSSNFSFHALPSCS